MKRVVVSPVSTRILNANEIQRFFDTVCREREKRINPPARGTLEPLRSAIEAKQQASPFRTTASFEAGLTHGRELELQEIIGQLGIQLRLIRASTP